MKNQKEIYEALLRGKELIHNKYGDRVKLIDGLLYALNQNNEWVKSTYGFLDNEDWSICEPPKEPMVIWVNVYNNEKGKKFSPPYNDEEGAKDNICRGGRTVKFIEVIEESEK